MHFNRRDCSPGRWPRLDLEARRKTHLLSFHRTGWLAVWNYYGVGERDGELGCVSERLASGDIAPISFLRASSSLGSVWAFGSCAALYFPALSASIRERSGYQGPKFGRKLLYSSLSFSFGLRGVGSFPRRLNDGPVRQGLFPLGYRVLSLRHRFLSLN